MKFAANPTDDQKSNMARFLWPSIVLLLGLSLTGAAWRYASIKEDEKSLAAFNLHTHDVSRDIQKYIEVYFGVLRSAGGFFAGSNFVTRAEFERFVSFLTLKENYPGIEGMGVIRYIPHSEKNKFENTVRRENGQGWADYAIRPPGARAAYFPVEYFWPPLNHLSLPGLDHGAYPAGLNALQKACDTGLVTMSATLPYAQDNDRNPPILFLFPIYRNGWPVATIEERQKAIWGFVYARVNVEKLFQGAISSSNVGEIYLEVFEGHGSGQEITSLNQANLIYDADPSEIPHALNASYKPRFSATQNVGIDGTSWLFYSSSRPGGTVEQRDEMPIFILLAGSFFSLGASVIAYMRSRGKQLIQQLAYYDCLTGLPNRSLLQDRFQQAIANAQRYGTGMALLFLDLDKFKPINDSLGHEAGDEVLKTVSTRLASCLREGDTLSRFGGDEFIVLLLNIAGKEEVSSVARKIIDIISEPISLNGQDAYVGCSIGISIFPEDGADFDALLRNADASMYRAKENGRNTFKFYPGILSVIATKK